MEVYYLDERHVTCHGNIKTAAPFFFQFIINRMREHIPAPKKISIIREQDKIKIIMKRVSL